MVESKCRQHSITNLLKSYYKFIVTTRQRVIVDVNSSQLMERDIFKKCLDLITNKQKAEELDQGEKDSLLDAMKANLQFCIQYEE